MPTDSIRVTRIKIENVFGIKHLTFSPDGVSVVRGDNNTGKTSVLRAIALLLGGGHDPDALRRGSEKGEVRFTLDDGTEVYARLTENNTYYRVEGRDDLTARQLLNQVQDEISVNPISIINARRQDRGQILLEAMPMTVDADRVSEAIQPVPVEVLDVTDFDISGHALQVLGDRSSGLIGEFYQERQSLHGAKRDKEGTVSDLEQSIEQHGDPDDLRNERTHVEKELDDQKAQRQDALDDINEWEKAEIERIRRGAKEKRETIREEFAEPIKTLEAKRERLTERIEQAERVQQTREIIEQRKRELSALEDRYDRLTEAIENLRGLRSDFAGDLPGGVSIGDDGEIYDDADIPFENWNEERQVRFAAKVADLRRGPLGLIPIDGIDALVGDQYDAFLEWASESDAQFILTEAVPNEDLHIDHA